MSVFNIKLYHSNLTRRYHLDVSESNFTSALLSHLPVLFRGVIGLDDVLMLGYIDQEGDFIVLDTDDEFLEVLTMLNMTKFIVVKMGGESMQIGVDVRKWSWNKDGLDGESVSSALSTGFEHVSNSVSPPPQQKLPQEKEEEEEEEEAIEMPMEQQEYPADPISPNTFPSSQSKSTTEQR